jgi:CBS domain-containing protein
MNPNIITIHNFDSAAKALATMRRYGIDRLVVVDDNNKALGIVTGKDILDRIISPRKNLRFSRSGEKDKTLSIMVDSIMSYPLITAKRNDSVKKIIELMLKNKISSVVVVKDGIPEGIVIKKDILETYLKKKTAVHSVQLITKDVYLDEFEKSRIAKDLERFMEKFKEFLGESVLFVYIKRHKENFRGLPLIYVRLKLTSEKGVFFVTGERYYKKRKYSWIEEW